MGEASGIPVWCEDEAGPYQAIPQPGQSWAPHGHPACHPHEYVRGGTAKMISLFRPATGELRAQGVERTPNVVLHAWVKDQLAEILDTLPPPVPPSKPEQEWTCWLGHAPLAPLPPLRLILVWDNLAGHYTPELVVWLFAQGILPLYTPVSGSWLNMAESVQRIVVRRALAGEHPQNAQEVIHWLDETVVGWNRNCTPFVWKGKRYERRQRARLRRLGGSGAAVVDCNLNAA